MLARPELLLPLIVFCAVSSFTPGPNNSMLMASGLNYGFRRTLPHAAGVVGGFTLLVMAAGFGVGAIFSAWPLAYTLLKYAGAAYMLYLAWKIGSAQSVDQKDNGKSRPFTFAEAAAFQLINPKGLIMAIGSVATYASIATYPANTFLIAGVFGLMGIGSSLAWAAFGKFLQRFMHQPKFVRAFNIIMGILLAASVIPVLFE